ncbi:hypothetical protein [Micromonospora coriariae]|nr:hypothetical protein [Micromonospora coriariae]
MGRVSGEGVAVGVGRSAGNVGDVATVGLGRLGDEPGVAGGVVVVAGSDRVLVGTAVGGSVTVGVVGGVAVGLGVGLGVGVGSGSGGPVGGGTGGGLCGSEAGGVLRVGLGEGGGGSTRTGPGSAPVGPRSVRSWSRPGAAGSQPAVAVGPTPGVAGGGSAGWLVAGTGMTTGPTDGVGMNGVLLSGSAVLPGVAEPALMAARMGIDAVPASSATVSR